LFKVGDDTYTLLTEANVGGRYCASHVAVDNPKSGTPAIGAKQDRDEIVGGNEEIDYDRNPYLFELRFAGTYGLPEMVTASLPLTTPWRVALAGNLSSVVDSNLVAALNEPSKIDDTSWIKHGRTDWSWWSNGDSPRSLEIQKKYVDYAAELGWEYTLVDRGWRREWMPELVEYANERDVGILAWLPWYYLNDDVKRERVLSRMKEFGVSGIKVDYMNADLQQRMEWYDQVLEATARHKLMVNFHGSTVPKGRRRTWPHLMTSEAIRGAENEGFGPMPASHDAIIPFTRNVVGPMDYTPVTFSAHGTAPATDRPAHELALSVVYQSDWQHFADSIESYRDHPLAEEFLSKVAAVWDETHLINGLPAEKATFARRDGDQWFVGNIVAGHGRTVDVPLSFTQENQQFTAQIIGNSGSGLEERKRNVNSTDTLSVEVQSDGGFVAYLNPCN
jgi:alpha-glucosidase